MKCYASDYCQKDKSSCSDVCGGYRVLRALTDWVRERMVSIINTRVSNNLTTIYTSTDADINIEHRLTEVEQRAKSNTNRLNEHDEILKSNSEMIGAIKELATEVKYMRGDLNETIERLNKLESKDGDKWEKFKWLIVAGLVTLILGYLAVSVGLK